ncbi:ImmA/IrrE family metallo-endopeptidase [Frankia sp. AgB1.9]|uniref:ImmA/IrrE family metallo-endopeptidase n=1 Tax=unclassified Frankia TaxID=2632575 RepID=UPI00193331A8|nr:MULTISPECIES: XRE family transcriptional regulator [unclassified Frankia]MBL7492278.1 ImmA/IrrE family metallo-endopeptidase [Frankia sp. AgW1.1]MBL7548982.1 ImmA/IrrE family metallo-endopeptidase [Frankia sp. AgB1.9]MBL7622568.1 ImmA/IrrE family metallo-endopeptidase [Frankia sp. AgB1.8]
MQRIGARALEQIQRVHPGSLQRDLAVAIDMTPDAFSRALNDKRAFSSLELARLADLLGADIHWLITGEPDPYRIVVAARHEFDHATKRRDVPGRETDDQALRDIALAYRQTDPNPRAAGALPGSPDAVRAALGDDFVRPFADRLEHRLGVDVVRVADLSTAYSIVVGGRRVIALPATGNWFWENWSLAHELGHLVLGHHDEPITEAERDPREAAANGFAADLLLPKDTLAAVDWDQIDVAGLADLVWRWGVSTDALARRIAAVTGYLPELVRTWAAQPTQRLLRRHRPGDGCVDEITARMDAAAQRRFPRALQEEHLERIAAGALGKGTLAWMLGIDPDSLEVDTPAVPEVPIDDLARALGL